MTDQKNSINEKRRSFLGLIAGAAASTQLKNSVTTVTKNGETVLRTVNRYPTLTHPSTGDTLEVSVKLMQILPVNDYTFRFDVFDEEHVHEAYLETQDSVFWIWPVDDIMASQTHNPRTRSARIMGAGSLDDIYSFNTEDAEQLFEREDGVQVKVRKDRDGPLYTGRL